MTTRLTPRMALLGIVAALIAAAPPGRGEPARPVADVRHVVAESTVEFLAGDGRYRFEIVAQKSMLGSGTADNADGSYAVTAFLCQSVCAQVGHFDTNLAAGDFQVADDLSTASLDTTMFGHPLKIEWARDGADEPGEIELTVYTVSSGHGARVVWTQDVLPAPARVAWGASNCPQVRDSRLRDRTRIDYPFASDADDAREPRPEFAGDVALICR